MNVYVESNFVLELALLQEQQSACETILRLCERDGLQLVLPAYSLVEPYETLRRRQADRQQMKSSLDAQFRQMSRTTAYRDRLQDFARMTSLLVDSAGEDMLRLESVQARLLSCSELVPLEGSILTRATEQRTLYGLSAQDSVVYASILVHLERSGEPGCFLSRDSDFDDPLIRRQLEERGAELLIGFEAGLQFLERSFAEGAE